LLRLRLTASATALLIACAALACVNAAGAQTASAPYDPLAPPDPKKKPPAYQTFDPNAVRKPVRDTTSFEAPPATGAGKTGFNSANTTRARAGAKPADAARKIAPGVPAAAPANAAASSTPRATADSARKSYASSQPGQPPVELGSQPPPRRRKKGEQIDPYEPLGIRSGGMLYYPAIELISGYDSNPSRSPDGHGSAIFTIAPELRMRSDWSSHSFKSDIRGSYNWYTQDETPSLNRPYLNATADGRIDVTRDTRIDLGGKLLVSTDNPNSPNLQSGIAELPIYKTFGGYAGIGQKFNRLDVSLKGAVERTVFDESLLLNGTHASNDDRNYNQYGGTLRTGYELRPGLTPFVEAAADSRVHDLPVDFSGFRRDSKGFTGKVGSTFELSRLLTGEVAVGYTMRKYDDARLEDLRGLIGNASLVWSASALTNVKLTAASTIGESNQAGVSGVLYRDAGLEIEHAFRRWLIGSVKGGFGVDDYVGSDREDKRYSLGGGLTYKMNRNVQLKGEYRHEWLNSNTAGNSYAADVFLLGLRLQE
jgi:hypothetical protein